MADIRELLSSGRIILSDGAWGTQLAGTGLAGACPELWNVEEPEAVRSVAAAYVAAGSDCILTNSFGGNPFKLAGYGLEARTEELNEAAAGISREAAVTDAAVLASVGPTGGFLEPYGSVTVDEMERAFRRQIGALLRGGADGIVAETMSDLGEALCALRAARAEGAPLVVVSLTFERKKAGMVSMMGVTAGEAARALSEAGCDVVGANCGCGIDGMEAAIRDMAAVTGLPLWAKPNAGLPRVAGGVTTYPEGPDEMAEKLPRLLEAGARIVGGCCGTTPAHLAAFRKRLG